MDLSAYIKKRDADFVPTYLIVRELKRKGYSEREISEAMNPVRDAQVHERNWRPYAIIVAIFIVLAYIIGFGKTQVMLISAILFTAKTLVYSLILFTILAMASAREKFEHCLYIGLIIAGITFITPAFIMYLILIVTVFYMMMGLAGGNLKTYTGFMIFLIISEVFASIAIT